MSYTIHNNTKQEIKLEKFNPELICSNKGAHLLELEGKPGLLANFKVRSGVSCAVHDQGIIYYGSGTMLYYGDTVKLLESGEKPYFGQEDVQKVELVHDVEEIFVTKDFVIAVSRKKLEIFCKATDGILQPKSFLLSDVALEDYAIATSYTHNILVYKSSDKNEIGNLKMFNMKTEECLTLENVAKHDVDKISCNRAGTLLATTSLKGTIVRVFDIMQKEKVEEFRRGTESAKVFSLSFSEDDKFLATYSKSSNYTLHVFSLFGDKKNNLNKKSKFAKVGKYVSEFFSSQWSAWNCQHEMLDSPGICFFSPANSDSESIEINTFLFSGNALKIKFFMEKEEKEIENYNLFDVVEPYFEELIREQAAFFKEKLPEKLPLLVRGLPWQNSISNELKKFLYPKKTKLSDIVYNLHGKYKLPDDETLRFYVKKPDAPIQEQQSYTLLPNEEMGTSLEDISKKYRNDDVALRLYCEKWNPKV